MRPRIHLVGVSLLTLALAVALGCGPDSEVLWEPGNALIRGVVKDPLGSLLPQASVGLEGHIKPFSAYTDKNGAYEVRDILPDMYDVVVHRVIGGTDYRFRVRFLDLKADAIIDMPDLQLQLPAQIRGQVTLRGSGPLNPNALSNANVAVELVGTSITALTDAAGNYTLSPVEVAIEAPRLGQGLGLPTAATYELRVSRSGYADQTVQDVAVSPGGVTSVPTLELLPLNPSTAGALAGRVLLEAARNDDHGLVKVQIDGTTRSLVTTSGGYYRFDNLATGTYTLSYRRDRYFDQVKQGLAVVPGIPVNAVADVKLSNHRRINETVRAYELAVAPSGNQLAYITNDATTGGEIALIHPDGQAFNQVITSGARAVGNRGLVWSLDEQELFFVRYHGGPIVAYDLGLTSNTGSVTRSILASGTDYYGVAVSPDNKRLAFYLTSSLYHVPLDRSSGSTLAVTGSMSTIVPIGTITSWSGLEWANTGRLVYSAVLPGASSEVWTILAGGGGSSLPLQPTLPGTATPVLPPLVAPTFSPDWSRVAFSVEAPSTSPLGLYVCDIDGANALRLTESPGRHLKWSPRGDRIYYTDADARICELLVPQL